MLQEILLSMSGHTSPIWAQVDQPRQTQEAESLKDYVSPPELAMLGVLGHLSDLHMKLKEHTAQISSSHKSTICRAVAASIAAQQLSKFRQKVLDVEVSVLSRDSKFVGGYDIVPLSTLVGEFTPWTRRLEWLLQITLFMNLTQSPVGSASSTGAALIDHLETERFTGYSDLEDMASNLLAVAHAVWMRQVSSWILYGKIPVYGAEDFFVQQMPGVSDGGYKAATIIKELLPAFTNIATAESILAIGNSLNHIRYQSRSAHNHAAIPASDPALELLPQHLAHLQNLAYPLSTASVASAVSSIRVSISQNALSSLLPPSKVLEVTKVIHQFLLLGRGEFAVSLIRQADALIATRESLHDSNKPFRKVGRLENLTIKDVELNKVLHHTWSELASFQSDDESHEHIFDEGRKLIRMTNPPAGKAHATEQVSTLFPTPTMLAMSISPTSPLSLFLDGHDIESLSTMTSYLISLRRAELHLSDLWKVTPLRRCYPAPTKLNSMQLLARRARDNARMVRMRKHWAVAARCLFVLNEMGIYFHGEVIAGHFAALGDWVKCMMQQQPDPLDASPMTASSKSAARQSDLRTSQISAESRFLGQVEAPGPSDPVVIAHALRGCLAATRLGLLLDNKLFVNVIRELLPMIDHFIGLHVRLQAIWEGLDLQEDEGLVDALTNYKKDEGEIWWEMERSGKLIEESLAKLVDAISAVGGDRDSSSESALTAGFSSTGLGDGTSSTGLVPWRGRKIERLILKLESMGNRRTESEALRWNEDDD